MKSLIAIISILAFAPFTQASPAAKVLCSTVGNDKVTVRLTEKGANWIYEELDENLILLSRTVVDRNRTNIWDGHASGLITAKGFSMTYDNHFGCTKNVSVAITASRSLEWPNNVLLRRVHFATCAGMSSQWCESL